MVDRALPCSYRTLSLSIRIPLLGPNLIWCTRTHCFIANMSGTTNSMHLIT